MKKRVDLTGQYFGRLLVIGDSGFRCCEKVLWLCLCSCGKGALVSTGDLKSGKQRSCGCLHSDVVAARNKEGATHRSTHTRLYSIWIGIKNRCYNKRDDHMYRNYGARGIKMCDEWRKDFVAFRNWALDNGYADTLSIERIDVDGDYCPENCTWIPLERQQRNMRQTVRVDGVPLRDITESLGLDTAEADLVYRRYVTYGWPLDEALGLIRRNKVRGRYHEFAHTPAKQGGGKRP